MTWVHLRMCQGCGHIGCCDNSEGKHATAHNAETGHPIIRSAEPGEDWSWCYEDQLMFRLARFEATSGVTMAENSSAGEPVVACSDRRRRAASRGAGA